MFVCICSYFIFKISKFREFSAEYEIYDSIRFYCDKAAAAVKETVTLHEIWTTLLCLLESRGVNLYVKDVSIFNVFTLHSFFFNFLILKRQSFSICFLRRFWYKLFFILLFFAF